MMLAVIFATVVAIPLLAIVSFVQVLYLESMRLRTRDLPSLKFFKETLEDKLGMKTERGAGAFSLVKHTLLLLVGICYFAWIADGQPWSWEAFWQAGLAAWLTMMAVSYALPQLLYRRTRANWLAPSFAVLPGLLSLSRLSFRCSNR